MSASSRSAVAIHILGMVAGGAMMGDAPVTSEDIAESVNTNPVVIRRILGSLRAAGLVSSQPGAHGGWRLTRQPEAITLRDIYHAVEDDEPLFALPQRAPNPGCRIGANIRRVVGSYFRQAEAAMEASLACATLADVLRDLIARHSSPSDAESQEAD